MMPLSMSSFDSASVCARLEMRSSWIVTGVCLVAAAILHPDTISVMQANSIQQ